MNTYVIGYWTEEESAYTYLTHENSYTSDEFAEIIHRCVKAAIDAEKHRHVHSYENIHSEVVELLCTTQGFSVMEADVRWTVFGWASMFKPHDWSDYRDEPDELTALTEYLHKHGFTEKDDDHIHGDETE